MTSFKISRIFYDKEGGWVGYRVHYGWQSRQSALGNQCQQRGAVVRTRGCRLEQSSLPLELAWLRIGKWERGHT